MSIQSNFPAISPSLLLDFANTKQLDNRVTFTRSTPAVYYDGKTTAMAEQNLLTYSQNSTTNWTVTNNTVTLSATTAPDGTTTAMSVVPSTASTPEHLLYQPFTGTAQPYTFSIYAKANGYNWVYLRPQIAGNLLYASFNLSTGTIGTVSSGVTATITSVGNGWYRCTATRTMDAIGCFYVVGVANADNAPNFAGDGTSGAYLWGAQLEQRSSATAYTATTTQPITNYIPVLLTAGGNQPRFDCNPTTGESLGLLIEEARTNLQTYSSTGSGWVSYLSVTWISSSVVAPNGQIQGADVTFPSGSQMYSYTASFGSSGIAVTASAYMKYRSGASIVGIGVYDNTQGNRYVYFDLSNGTISSSDSGTSGTITSVGNGWYRCTNTKTVQNASGGMSFYASNGACNIYTWGAQLEVGAFATSYIATTSASATRTADQPIMSGSNFTNWYNQAEGTIYLDYANANVDSGTRLLEIWQGSPFSIPVEIASDGSTWSAKTYNYGAYQVSLSLGSTSASGKLIYSIKTNNFTACANGGTVNSQTSGLLGQATELNIGFTNRAGTETQLNGCIKKLAYYPLRLSNTNLQALTS